jgi:hypothetical protein
MSIFFSSCTLCLILIVRNSILLHLRQVFGQLQSIDEVQIFQVHYRYIQRISWVFVGFIFYFSLHKHVNFAASFSLVNKALVVVGVEVVETALRYHSITFKDSFLIILSKIFKSVWLPIVEVKMNVQEVIYIQVVAHREFFAKVFLPCFKEVYFKLTLKPVFANPAILKPSVQI